MKFRACFVANSSTTNFVLFGMELKGKDKKRLEETFGDEDLREAIEEHYELDVYEDEQFFGIGKSLGYGEEIVKTTEVTLLQYMREVRVKLRKLLNKEPKLNIFSGTLLV